jgi:hypothetical protein
LFLSAPFDVVSVPLMPGSMTTVAQPNVPSGCSTVTFAAFGVWIRWMMPPSLPLQVSGQKDVERNYRVLLQKREIVWQA